MSKILSNKWILFLVFIMCFVLLDIQVKNVALSERGIVLGIGIDKESDEYIVTAEILAPSNLGAENYQKNRILALERGKTIEEAFEKMDKSLGVRVSLRHTVLIVLGNSMLKDGTYGPLIDLFVASDVADSTYIVGTHGSAKSVFDAKPALYSTISYKIAETFRSPDIESGIVITNVKDFFKLYLSPSGAVYIPIVEIGRGKLDESNSKGESSETDSINMSRVGILDKKGLRVVLDREESEGLSYIYSNVNEANVYVEGAIGEGGFDMDIVETEAERYYDTRNNLVDIRIKMWVKMGHVKSDSVESYIRQFGDAERKLAGETIKKSVIKAYRKCHEKGVDILGIATGYHKRLGKRYREVLGDDYLDKVNVNVNVKLIVK